MGIFGEKYSRENFDDAMKDKEDIKKKMVEIAGPKRLDYSLIGQININEELGQKMKKADKRVNRLFNKVRAEAIAENKKYDKENPG